MGKKRKLPTITVEVVVKPEAAEQQAAALDALAGEMTKRMLKESRATGVCAEGTTEIKVLG